MTDREFYNSFRSVEKEKNERRKLAITIPNSKQEIDLFNDYTFNKIVLDPTDEHNLAFTFDTINCVLTGGFDYMHYSPVGEMLDDGESLIGMSSNISILVNEEQLYKLKQVINCFSDFKFMTAKYDDDSCDYSIWFKNTNVSVSIIPFRRENDDIYLDLDSFNGSYDGVMTLSSSEHSNIPYYCAKSIYDEEDFEEMSNPIKKINIHINSKEKGLSK